MRKHIGIFALLWLLAACTSENDPGSAESPLLTEQDVNREVAQLFPFTSNQPFSALYLCGRRQSQLAWYFRFAEDGQLQVLFTTDSHEDFVFSGSYTYQNDQLGLNLPGGPNSPFPQGLDERSTVIMPAMGLVGAFATPEMICICIGHGENAQDPPRPQVNYDCPTIRVQAATEEDNAIELMHREMPFGQPIPGSVFRQQDTWVTGMTNPLIRRGYGIYRQDGHRFYAHFRLAQDFADYAGDQLPVPFQPGVPFEDYNLISGDIDPSFQELTVDQWQPEAGPCRLRR